MSVSTFCVISLTEEHVCLFVCFSSEMSEWSFISEWYHVISGEITFLNHLGYLSPTRINRLPVCVDSCRPKLTCMYIHIRNLLSIRQCEHIYTI